MLRPIVGARRKNWSTQFDVLCFSKEDRFTRSFLIVFFFPA